MSAQAAFAARVVAETVNYEMLGKHGLDVIERVVSRRVKGALSDVPAERVATAAWLLEASGRDAPDALDLEVEAAREGLREVAVAEGWDASTSEDIEARVEAALRATAGIAG